MTIAAKPAWRNRIVGSGEVAPGGLIPNEKNWRLHPRRQVAALEGALDEVGWVQQVIVNRRTGRLVDGHARVKSAVARREASVPVLYVDLTEAEEAFALVPSPQVGYVWHAGIHAAEVAAGLVGIGFEIVQQVIWDKGLFAMGRSWYHWGHEPCWVMRRPGVPNLFQGSRDQSTVWRAPSPKMIMAGSKEEKYDHPAQKPVVLFETSIRNHAGDVYDPFVGSGTTLIAAEQLDRRCYAMELDPRYVQVAIERWKAFTGQEAVRVDS